MSRSITKNPLLGTVHLPLFLAPAFATLAITQQPCAIRRAFSGSTSRADNRHRSREKNKNRGVSAIRRTGPRVPLSVSKYPLPVPVIDPAKREEIPMKKDHGLWGFFNDARQPMLPGEEEGLIGRSWTYTELSWKSFADLHALHWVCVKELNRTLTRRNEMKRLHSGYGKAEIQERVNAIRRTMSKIRLVLRDRCELYEEARFVVDTTDSKDPFFSDAEQESFEEVETTSLSPEDPLPDTKPNEQRQ